jgi:predicted CXXCH cytochrome family protein
MVPLAAWAARRHLAAAERHDEFVATVPQQMRPGWATSDRCEACHPSQYHSWHRGYHRTMTQYASPTAVRGDFNDVRLAGDGYDARLFRRGDDFMVEMVDPLWQYEVDFGQRPPPDPGQPKPRVERRISMVTGSHHMQAFWVPSLVGNGQLSLPFTYLFDDKRWVPRGEVFLHPPGGRHQEQVWNVSCITCHTTAGQPNALVGGKEVRSQVGEMGIACEACHGPADEHVAANQNPFRRYWLHLRGQGDPTIVNPKRLAASNTTRANEICGQCHSLTDLSDDIYLGDGKSYVAGAELEKSQPLLRQLHPSPALAKHIADDPAYLRGYFWADGTIRVSSRDYSGLVESKCNGGGKLWCGSCHSLHESDPVNLLAADMERDAACTQCHPEIGKNVAAHTHHRTDSVGSHCYNCHMPYTVYGLLKGIRNHRIDSPHVTGKSGGNERPNACNLCHTDRSLGWAANALGRWYKQPVPNGLTDDTPASIEWLLSGDAVLRAIAAWQLGWDDARATAPTTWAIPYLAAAMADPYSAVRYVAGHSLKKIDPTSDFDYLAPVDQRQAAIAKILTRWRTQFAAGEHDSTMDATAIAGRIKRLIDKRDDTPVRAME